MSGTVTTGTWKFPVSNNYRRPLCPDPIIDLERENHNENRETLRKIFSKIRKEMKGSRRNPDLRIVRELTDNFNVKGPWVRSLRVRNPDSFTVYQTLKLSVLVDWNFVLRNLGWTVSNRISRCFRSGPKINGNKLPHNFIRQEFLQVYGKYWQPVCAWTSTERLI